jgi:AcrR family transcriptional regulator
MPSPDFELRWVKPPRQDRSRSTHDRFVEAAQRLLGRGRSWAEITVADLARAAESSVGAFYSRFRDKNALLHVLQIELNREGSATAAETLALGDRVALPLAQLVRAFVALAITAYRQQQGLRRALLVQMCSDAEFRARATELSKETCAGLEQLLQTRFPRTPPGRIATVVDIAHRIVYGLLDQRLLFADASPTGRELEDEPLIEELAAAISAYIAAQLA